jgi:hypothetical protein
VLLNSRLLSISRSLFFVTAVFLFATKFQTAIVRAGRACESYCSTSVNCSDSCLDDYDQDSTCGAYGVCAPDCSDVCGSGSSCSTPCSGGGGEDCGAYNGGKSNGECFGFCGDGVCEMPYETCNTCSADCGACTESCALNTCTQDSDCGGGGVSCDGACCIGPCGNDYCGTEPRECDNSYEPCGGSPNDCCDNEICGSIDGGDPVCVGPLT